MRTTSDTQGFQYKQMTMLHRHCKIKATTPSELCIYIYFSNYSAVKKLVYYNNEYVYSHKKRTLHTHTMTIITVLNDHLNVMKCYITLQ